MRERFVQWHESMIMNYDGLAVSLHALFITSKSNIDCSFLEIFMLYYHI